MKYANDIDAMTKNHMERLADMMGRAGGVFDNIPWGTMRGQMFTLGTMTDDHVANSLHYHKHIAEVARVAPEFQLDYDECKFCQFLMETIVETRITRGAWTIPSDDFRMAS